MNFLAFGTPGPSEWMLILIIVLVLFGAKKLPELARSLGQSMNEFRKAREEFDRELQHAARDIKPSQPQTQPQPQAQPQGHVYQPVGQIQGQPYQPTAQPQAQVYQPTAQVHPSVGAQPVPPVQHPTTNGVPANEAGDAARREA